MNAVKQWKITYIFGCLFFCTISLGKNTPDSNSLDMLNQLDKELIINSRKSQNPEHIKNLIDLGADPNTQDENGYSAMLGISASGNMDLLEHLEANKADFNRPDKKNYSTLHAAASSGNVNAIQFVMKTGIDVNTKDLDGYTPLFLASAKGDVESVKYLIRKGADPTIKNKNGDTALHWAAWNGNLEVVKLLIHKSNIDTVNGFGSTALYDAVWNNQIEVIKFLLSNGANPNIKNKYGKSPITLAAKDPRVFALFNQADFSEANVTAAGDVKSGNRFDSTSSLSTTVESVPAAAGFQ